MEQPENLKIYVGDCITVMQSMPDNSIDSIVTDPPYGLGFMGKEWDELPPGKEWAAECLRVLKPGGHLLAFGGTRTWHRLAVAVEDAGFEIRDSLAWLYGSGFPKSLDVSKAIDKAAGATRDVVSEGARSAARPVVADQSGGKAYRLAGDASITAPATDDARQWAGWGTALKPAFEPVVFARKPFPGTVAQNVLAHGTGALNIDGSRIPGVPWAAHEATGLGSVKFFTEGEVKVIHKEPHGGGRWPANVLLDEHAAELLGEQSGTLSSGNGGASRFFYVAKAPAKERPKVDGVAHPTVKPLTLMRHLVKLVTPPGGTVLDPFLGSGTTAQAALMEGFGCIGIEREQDYLPLIAARLGLGTPGLRQVV